MKELMKIHKNRNKQFGKHQNNIKFKISQKIPSYVDGLENLYTKFIKEMKDLVTTRKTTKFVQVLTQILQKIKRKYQMI